MNAPVTLPIIVKEWERNGRGEKIRVTLDHFKSADTIDARVWWTDEAGEVRPGKGLTLGLKHLPALAEAIAEALVLARKHGLIGDGAYRTGGTR